MVYGKTQIGVDVPRTLSEVPFFQEAVIQSTLTRILYIWWAALSTLLWCCKLSVLSLNSEQKCRRLLLFCPLYTLKASVSYLLLMAGVYLFNTLILMSLSVSSCRAIRHPASGYVQGINDLATPFIVVFLSEYLEGDIDTWDLSKLSPGSISKVSWEW